MDSVQIDDAGHQMYLPDTCILHNGDILKVPYKAIETDEIGFNNY